MDSLVHADIFFFITSIAVLLGGLLLCVLIIYGILIFRDIRSISQNVKRETELLAMDIDAAREHIKEHGMQFTSIFGFLKDIFSKKRKKH